jgi:hypothetical protein
MNNPSAQLSGSADPASPSSARDEFIDLCRAFSLLVVVLWHWVFTIVVWRSSGPSADSPLGFTRDLWVLTWVLQVMPVFFFVGGHAHLQLWSKLRGSGASFVMGRMRRLLVPSLALLAVWAAIAAVAEGIFHVYWFGRAALLIVSPLWFIAVYLIGYRPPNHPTLAWWTQRPLWLVVPLICTIPVILVFGRRIRGPRRPVPVPAPRARRHLREPLVTAGRRIGSKANGPARA